jgi:hypothetical protein
VTLADGGVHTANFMLKWPRRHGCSFGREERSQAKAKKRHNWLP